MPTRTGTLRSARLMPPGPTVSPTVCVMPWRAGTSRSTAMERNPPVEMHTITKSAPSSASLRSVAVATVALASIASFSLCASASIFGSGAGSMSSSTRCIPAERGRAEQVCHELRRPLIAAATDDRHLRHPSPSLCTNPSRCLATRGSLWRRGPAPRALDGTVRGVTDRRSCAGWKWGNAAPATTDSSRRSPSAGPPGHAAWRRANYQGAGTAPEPGRGRSVRQSPRRSMSWKARSSMASETASAADVRSSERRASSTNAPM